MEAEKSQDLQWTSQRPNSVVQAEPESLRTRRANGVSSSPSLNLKASEDWSHNSKTSRDGEFFSYSASLFYLGFQEIEWSPPILRRALLSLLIQMLISSRNTYADTPKIVFNQIPGHLMAQPSWHLKLTITKFMLSRLCAFNVMHLNVHHIYSFSLCGGMWIE